MIETDYLVVGAGAAAMAFVDTLVAETDADVVMVDRRHAPGGHWIDSYPFVRIHHVSAIYGVNSRALGTEAIDTVGPNAGFYDRSTGLEICDYYHKVLDEHLVRSGRVRFFGMSGYVGDWATKHAIVSRLTRNTTEVRVRRKIVDTTYLQLAVPATHTPPFPVDPDTWMVPVGRLVDLAETPSGYTILGAGKTAMDACNWLLDAGVDPDRIRWIKPRDAWVWDRACLQPLDLIADMIETLSLAIEAAAHADSVDDYLHRLEDIGFFGRTDPAVEPTMLRGAILSRRELERLRQIERVVRHGRVKHLGADRIVLERGTIPTSRGELHVDCTADGLGSAPARPVFEAGRITIQSPGLTPANAALAAFLEANRDDDADKNRLSPPSPALDAPIDWLTFLAGFVTIVAARSVEPDVAAWTERTRLNALRGMTKHLDDPRMQTAMARWADNMQPAIENLERLLHARTAPTTNPHPSTAEATTHRCAHRHE